jgi:hypothetical protein
MPDPNSIKGNIHSDFSITSGTWTGYRVEVTGLYNDYSSSNLDSHVCREFNKKIRDLGQPEALYISPFDAGLRYTGDGSTFS